MGKHLQRFLSTGMPILLLLSTFGCSSTPNTSTPAATPSAIPTPATIPCTIVSGGTAPAKALKATITGNDHTLGPASAAVTILTYSDFQCPMCAFVADSLNQVHAVHPEDVRLVFRHLPLTNVHDKATLAIQAAEAAGMRGKFWEMHDLLFQKQQEWKGLTAEAFPAWVGEQAASLGLDKTTFQDDFQGETVQAIVNQSIQFAAGIANPSVPLLFINSTTVYTGPVNFAGIEEVIQLTALTQKQFTTCPPTNIDITRQYLAILHTSKGDIVIQLYADKAPIAVTSFVFLARSGWYDGMTFYRVTSTTVETGDPSDTGLGNPGYLFNVEGTPGLKFDHPGMVALMNDGPATNGCRFFITLTNTPEMNGKYTIIGQVLSGMDVLSSMTKREPIPGLYLTPGDPILQVIIEEK